MLRIIILSVFLLVPIIQSANAQLQLVPQGGDNNTEAEQQTQSVSNGWENYTDSTYNFKMIYPSDWAVKVDPDQGRILEGHLYLVHFNNSDTAVTISTFPAKKVLDTNTLQVISKSPEQYANERIQNETISANLIGQLGINSEFKFIKSMPTTVDSKGDPAWRIDYMNSFRNIPSYNIEMIFVKNDQVFDIVYSTDPLKVPETLHIAEKMISSIQFL